MLLIPLTPWDLNRELYLWANVVWQLELTYVRTKSYVAADWPQLDVYLYQSVDRFTYILAQ